MAKNIYEKIKKQNGELFAKTLRRFDNGIFDIEGIDKIVRFAGRNPVPILGFLESLKGVEIVDEKTDKTPFELLSLAGYDAFVADTFEKQNSILPYFHKGEELCTFNDETRYLNYHIIHAIKQGADKLNRADFVGKEEREDEYGTSVISIQILKEGGFISIKNRYNHTVLGCDNTFNSNPDNIIRGLSYAIKKYFGVDFSSMQERLPYHYTFQNGMLYRYSLERNNAYFGDGFYLLNGACHEIQKDYQILFDCFVYDTKSKEFLINDDLKTIYTFFEKDGMDVILNELKDKVIQIQKEGQDYILLANENEVLRIRNSRLIGLTLYVEGEQDLSKLKCFQFLEWVNFKRANCVNLNVQGFYALKNVFAPMAEQARLLSVGDASGFCFLDGKNLKEVALFCPHYTDLKVVYETDKMRENGMVVFANMAIDIINKKCVSKLSEISMGLRGFYTLLTEELKAKENISIQEYQDERYLIADGNVILVEKNGCLQKINFVDVTYVPENTFQLLPMVEEILLPNVGVMGGHNMRQMPHLKSVYMPNLMHIDEKCFSNLEALKELTLPVLEKAGEVCFSNNKKLKFLCLDMLEHMGPKSCLNNESLEEISLNNLKSTGFYCFNYLESLKKVSMPNIQTIERSNFQDCNMLECFSAPELTFLGSGCFSYPEFKALYAPKLLSIWQKEYLPFLKKETVFPLYITTQKNHSTTDIDREKE